MDVGTTDSFFFFSSRRRHTRCSRDWSSDVCSSDLARGDHGGLVRERGLHLLALHLAERALPLLREDQRSEERRVGKEGRSRWSPYHLKKKKKIIMALIIQ